MSTETMRAWELRGAGLEKLVLVDRPEPVPGPGQIKIKVRAAALNSRDLQVIHGRYDPNQRYPIVPVSDGVGEVAAVGPGVTRVAVGDRVTGAFAQRWVSGRRTWDRWASHLGGHLDGLLQEYALLEEDGAVAVPGHLDDVQAAAVGVAGSTAWHALVELGRLQPGETVLLQGTGGVSLFALQLARMVGARAIVTSGSDEKLERARALGAWAGVNYRTHPDWEVRVLELTGQDGVDHIVENVGDLRRSVQCLRVGGLISAIGYLGQLSLEGGPAGPMSYSADLASVLLKNVRLHGISAAPRESYEAMFRAMGAHQSVPVIDQVFPLTEAKAALARLASGKGFGKVCLRITDSGL